MLTRRKFLSLMSTAPLIASCSGGGGGSQEEDDDMPLSLSRWQYVNPHNQKFKPAVENLPWFDVRAGEWYFECPMEGTLDGQPDTSPRSEMRELIGGNAAKWDIFDGPHQLDAALTLDEVVERVVIGQIHADEDEPAKIHVLRSGEVYMTDDADQPTVKRYFKDASNNQLTLPIGTNAPLTYFIKVTGGSAKAIRGVITIGGIQYKAEWPLNAFWQTADYCYFKAGIYCHTNDPSQYQPTEKYRARFTSMVASH
jgi:hypothetical protein